MNATVEEYSIAGGGARDALWNQIKSDALAAPIERAEVEYPENLGAAMLAALGTKKVQLGEIKSWVTIAETYQPRPANTRLYSSLLRVYLDLYKETRNLVDVLKELPISSE